MSTVVLDTITGKSTATTITIGSTPVVSSATGALAIKDTQGNVNTDIQHGLSKTWASVQGTDTFGMHDSHNITSATDHSTGNHTLTFANDFNSATTYTYAFGVWNTADEGSSSLAADATGLLAVNRLGNVSASAASMRFSVMQGSTSGANGAIKDASQVTATLHGDLA